MTRDEFRTIISQVTDPNHVAEALVQLNDGVEAIFNDNERLTAENTQHSAIISELRDTNMRLFLRISGNEEPHHENVIEEMEPAEALEALVQKIGGYQDGN